MRKIKNFKLFESVEVVLSEEDIKSCLIELYDLGYQVSINIYKNAYQINITCPESGENLDDYFYMSDIGDILVTFIDYLKYKLGETFSYIIIKFPILLKKKEKVPRNLLKYYLYSGDYVGVDEDYFDEFVNSNTEVDELTLTIDIINK
jgi:hypothetical protein